MIAADGIRVERPHGEPTPLVVSVPHAGTAFPPEELPLYRAARSELERDSDLWVDELFAEAPALGATLVSSPWSRFVVDLNRFSDDLAPTGAVGAVRRTSDGYYGDRGVIWAFTTQGAPIYRNPLTHAVVTRRLANYFEPYHRAVTAALGEAVERFGYAVLLDAHSMPARATRVHRDAGEPRPDVIPGDLDGRSCAPSLRQATEEFWRARGLVVRSNWPYRGGAITRTYGRPALGVHAIQLELNRRLYMDEVRLERLPRFDEVRHRCTEFTRLLSAWHPNRT
jgi:N-formylglutamate amidohydrolase